MPFTYFEPSKHFLTAVTFLALVDYHNRRDEVDDHYSQRNTQSLIICLHHQIYQASQQVRPQKKLKLAIVYGIVDHIGVPSDQQSIYDQKIARI